ncbi:MAG: hypothetical protein RG741_00165 [Bacteroidales bacterium]|nr:hypothetical protein [Bacteroidales bacterium]
MDYTYKASKRFKAVAALLIVIGIAALVYGFITEPAQAWTNILLNNMFYLTIAMGALLFFALQYVTNSGWSALFQRLPLALGAWLPAGALVMLLLYFGLPDIYKWAQPGIVEADKLIAHKRPFLNVPFYMIRIIIYFSLWISLMMILRRHAAKEDAAPNLLSHDKLRYYSKVFIFVAAFFFSLAAIDWIMTIDAHWYSTLFGFRAAVTSIYYAVAVIVLMIWWLRRKGFFSELNLAHRHDFARYLFRFSVVWGYLWFMQFLIIWYANIPEMTAYYYPRFLGEWRILFYAEPLINFAIPCVLMMSDVAGRNKILMITVSLLLVFGLWISLYLQIMPGSAGNIQPGIVEAGSWLGFTGLFLFMVSSRLEKAPMIPVNHPQLEESKHHHL